MRAPSNTVIIRPAYPDDDAAITRLAALDSAALPCAPFLLAESEGELLAALSLSSGRVIADPFHPTLQLVAMLRAYAAGGTSAQRAQRGERRYRSGRLALGY